jgi:hypothetical protein
MRDVSNLAPMHTGLVCEFIAYNDAALQMIEQMHRFSQHPKAAA